MNIICYDYCRSSLGVLVHVPTSCHHSWIAVLRTEQGNAPAPRKAGPGLFSQPLVLMSRGSTNLMPQRGLRLSRMLLSSREQPQLSRVLIPAV